MQTEKQIVKEELEQMANRIKNNIDAVGATASGKTAKSMRVDGTDFGAILSTRPAFEGLEIGKAPGNVPKGFNAIIKQWIIDKGITITQIPYKRKASLGWTPKYSTQERSLNMAAGAIASSIEKTGTALFKEGGRDDVYSIELKITTDIIKKRLSSEVISQIKSNIKG